MAVTYFAPDEHPDGFVGFHVTAEVGDSFYQRHFNTYSATEQSDTDVYFLYRRLEAELQSLEWERDSLHYHYERFVSENAPNTQPERGVGVHGITAAFARRGRGPWRACFKVDRFHSGTAPRQPARLFTFSEPYSQVWEEAVAFWAQEHGVYANDMDRLLESPPDPEQFKHLRRQMNEREGCDIPVEALSPVFAEQRSVIARQRAALKAKEMKLQVGLPSPLNKDIQMEMAAWFESVTRNGG